MSTTNKIEVDFCLLAFVIVLIAFIGEPDLIDSIIYKNMQPDCPVPIMTQSETIRLMERAYAK